MGVELSLRNALEPWHVMGEEGSAGGTVRYVDSSLERIEVRVTGLNESRARHHRQRPARCRCSPPARVGEFVAGVRYRAWNPPSALHPTHRRACAADLRHRRHLDEALAGRLPVPRGASGRPQLRHLPGQRLRGRKPTPGAPTSPSGHTPDGQAFAEALSSCQRNAASSSRSRSTCGGHDHLRPGGAHGAGVPGHDATMSQTSPPTSRRRCRQPARQRVAPAVTRSKAMTSCAARSCAGCCAARAGGALVDRSSTRWGPTWLTGAIAAVSWLSRAARVQRRVRRGRCHLQRARAQTAPSASREWPLQLLAVHHRRRSSGAAIERGVAQRARLLNATLADVWPARKPCCARRGAAAVAGVRAPTVLGRRAAWCRRRRAPARGRVRHRARPRRAAGGCCRSGLQAPSGLGYLLENRAARARRSFPRRSPSCACSAWQLLRRTG